MNFFKENTKKPNEIKSAENNIFKVFKRNVRKLSENLDIFHPSKIYVMHQQLKRFFLLIVYFTKKDAKNKKYFTHYSKYDKKCDSILVKMINSI